MRKGAPAESDGPDLASDYASARFRISVTFRGITADSVGPLQPFTLTHTSAAMVVRYLGDEARGLPAQVRIVPWGNVACAEPHPAFLLRYLDAMRGRQDKR